MQQLNLPDFNLSTKQEGGKLFILDEVRKKWVANNPEEWVRQHFIHFLNNDLGYPFSLMKIEVGLTLNSMQKRADILCHDLEGNPLLMVECKAPQVALNQSTFDQIARYNLVFKVPYLVITNGINHFCCLVDVETKQVVFKNEIPAFKSLT